MSSRLAISCCDSVVPSTQRRASALSAASAARLSTRRSVPAKFEMGRGGPAARSTIGSTAGASISGGKPAAASVSAGAAAGGKPPSVSVGAVAGVRSRSLSFGTAAGSASAGGAILGAPAQPFGRATGAVSTKLMGNPRKEEPPRRGSSGGPVWFAARPGGQARAKGVAGEEEPIAHFCDVSRTLPDQRHAVKKIFLGILAFLSEIAAESLPQSWPGSPRPSPSPFLLRSRLGAPAAALPPRFPQEARRQ